MGSGELSMMALSGSLAKRGVEQGEGKASFLSSFLPSLMGKIWMCSYSVSKVPMEKD